MISRDSCVYRPRDIKQKRCFINRHHRRARGQFLFLDLCTTSTFPGAMDWFYDQLRPMFLEYIVLQIWEAATLRPAIATWGCPIDEEESKRVKPHKLTCKLQRGIMTRSAFRSSQQVKFGGRGAGS